MLPARVNLESCKALEQAYAQPKPNMKKNRQVAQGIVPVEPSQSVAVSDERENELSVESDLSPGRTMEGASVTTVVLSQILTQREGPHQPRDWGINE